MLIGNVNLLKQTGRGEDVLFIEDSETQRTRNIGVQKNLKRTKEV
jgi:hypothetical protein